MNKATTVVMERGNEMRDATLEQVFGGVVTQAIDTLEAEGWETAIQYNVTQEEEGKYYIEINGFSSIGVDNGEKRGQTRRERFV